MHAFNATLSFLVTNSSLFFFVAIIAFFASLVAQKRSIRFARIVALVSLCACAPLFVLYAIVSILRPDAYTIILTAIWGWSAWSAWKTWRRLRSSKSAPARPRPEKPTNRWN
ncbi:MAG: hypothetical protein WC866_04435 [Patescibacteria group bacterium]|jgi:hypothetical protein